MMNKPALRIGFAGTPAFAASHLESLISHGHHVLAVYTQPDRPAGRGKQPKASAVKIIAQTADVPVYQPLSLKNDDAQDQLRSLQLDLLIVVAYGLILPQAVLDIPRYGCINVHASLLPRWRGAAPIERAILAGDEKTGITIMQMDAGLDTGDILLSKETAITEQDNCHILGSRLSMLGAEAIEEVLSQIQAGGLNAQAQDDGASTYAEKLSKEDALIYWDKTASKIQRQVNAFYPRSPAYCFYKGERIRILQASIRDLSLSAPAGTISKVTSDGIAVACSNSCLLVTKIQLPGKAEVLVKDFLNGRKDFFSTGHAFVSAPGQ